MKFHEDILNGFKVIEGTYFCHRSANYKLYVSKLYKQELWFLYSARRLMVLNICMKFQADIFNGFHVKHRHYFVT